MSIASLAGVLKIFGGSDPSPEEQAQLAKEVMLMTLARATAADTNIKAIEIEKVREVLLARTGEDIPAADVRVAANSRMYEKAPLDKYISSSAKKLVEDVQQVGRSPTRAQATCLGKEEDGWNNRDLATCGLDIDPVYQRIFEEQAARIARSRRKAIDDFYWFCGG